MIGNIFKVAAASTNITMRRLPGLNANTNKVNNNLMDIGVYCRSEI